MSSRIFLVGEFKFPNVEANSLRVLANAKALELCGYDVKIVTAGLQNRSLIEEGKEWMQFSGISYTHSQTGRAISRGKCARCVSFLLGGWRLVAALKRWVDKETVAVITTAGGQIRYFPFLRRFCQKRHLCLLCDSMEWYEASHLPLGRWGPFCWDHEYCMRYQFPKADGVIAISSYLEKYYHGCGTSALCIPPLIDISEDKWSEWSCVSQPNDNICLAFIGTAGRKDLLGNVIRGLTLVGCLGSRVKVVIVGPCKEEVRCCLGSNAGLIDTLSESLCFSGRIPHQEALRNLAQADFSVILRPNMRYANAGFPTKLVESMAMGVPVICNLTSDIGLYIHDGQEGVVVRDCSPESFAEGLKRAIALTLEQRLAMRRAARLRAELSFDYHNWVEPLRGFMQKVLNKDSRKQIA
jgi:glycosyltransferase involved in cell wall biosynthesis